MPGRWIASGSSEPTGTTDPAQGSGARPAGRRWSAADLADVLGQHRPTPEQAAVIECTAPAQLVVAGAGSGKTETMASRVVWLIANGIVEPLLAAVGGSPEFGMGFHLREGNDATFVNIGAVLTAAVNFLIIAAVLYFGIVKPVEIASEHRKSGKLSEEEAPAPSSEDLLTEIRDLLAAQNSGK